MKKTIVYVVAFLPFLWLGACKDAETPAEQHNEQVFDNTNIEKDVEFVTKATESGIAEVALGNLALANAGAAEVKQMGQMMVTDHTAVNDELKNAAQPKNIAIPAAATNDQTKKIEDLSKKTGAEFDKDYVDLMVSEHKDAVSLFEKEAEKGNDPDLKTWAAAKLPTLRHHLQMAEEMKQRIK